jgi:hypothetical protein
MRIGLKIFGVAFALCGVFFLSLFPFMLGEGIRTTDHGAMLASTVLAAVGLGFLFAGRYYFQLNPDEEAAPRPASGLSRLLVARRQALKTLALIGLGLALVRIVQACLSAAWPGQWASGLLLIGAFALQNAGKKAADPTVTDNSDWMKVPEWIRRTFERAEKGTGLLVVSLGLLALWAMFAHAAHPLAHFVAPVALNALIAVFYARTALFFAYGDLRRS